MSRPNLVFVFADQMRADATGYNGDPVVKTPHLDRLAREQGLNFSNMIAGVPVCCPYRASLLTGQGPLTHGIFLNDIQLPTDRPTFGTCLKDAGYRTGYIGKWHLDGKNRAGFTPPGPRRQGFDFWAVGNCTHSYSKSLYYRDTPEPLYWDGYDAIAQTDLAIEFLDGQKDAGADDPFALFLSWGPPHNPYRDVPQRYLDAYPPDSIVPRPNCPEPNLADLGGYYAHIAALDEQLERLLARLEANGQLDETVFVFTSDHGDMLGSHGKTRKQHPYEESIHVPMLIRAPMQFGAGQEVDTLLNVWDLMPTLLSLLGVDVPDTVQGQDPSRAVTEKGFGGPEATLGCIPVNFSENWPGRPWRAARTKQHTYARSLDGPWLLYDNHADPYQLNNLANDPRHTEVQAQLDKQLDAMLAHFGDAFEPVETLLERYGYEVGAKNTYGYVHEMPK